MENPTCWQCEWRKYNSWRNRLERFFRRIGILNPAPEYKATLISSSVIAKEAALQVSKNLVFAKLAAKQFNTPLPRYGDTIKIRIPKLKKKRVKKCQKKRKSIRHH